MKKPLILASSSDIRLRLLRDAGLEVQTIPARVDEVAITQALLAEQAKPRDVADTLAEMKARKIADRQPGAMVLGCDQVLALGTELFSKPETPQQAAEQLNKLQGKTHQLLSALVLYDGQEPVWRQVGVARLTMRTATEAWIDSYVQRNWDSIRHSVGAYKLEEEGIQLFTQIEGDYFTILGLPMLPLLSYLRLRGFIET